MTETVLTNARLVLADQVVHGTVVIRNGDIAAVETGLSDIGEDCDGDLLLPGIVDLHTDNLERQVQPRSSARWPSLSALVAHDAQCAAAGVTTVLDALCFGDLGYDEGRAQTTQEGLADLDAMEKTCLLRAEHFLHLRCELPAPETPVLVEPAADHPRVRLVSLMDHSPGYGQYADLDRYRKMRMREGMTLKEANRRIAFLQDQRARVRPRNRRTLLEMMTARAIPLASHDDGTEQEVAENAADGIRISEFPTTLAAARAAKQAEMTVIAGAPNVVRGGSHSGNASARELAEAGELDILSSDYVPAALLMAAFRLADAPAVGGLAGAIRLVSKAPAEATGLHDRGEIAVGRRADLLRVATHDGEPVVRAVWRQGRRVA